MLQQNYVYANFVKHSYKIYYVKFMGWAVHRLSPGSQVPALLW